MKEIFAPQIDKMIFALKDSNPRNRHGSKKLIQKFQIIFNAIRKIKPERSGPDNLWHLWLGIKKSSTKAKKWYELTIISYKKQLFISLDQCQFTVHFDANEIEGLISSKYDEKTAEKFVEWLMKKIIKEVEIFKNDPIEYNKFIARELPLSERYGKILRKDFWNYTGDDFRIDKELGEAAIKSFERFVKKADENKVIPHMTAGDFYGYCEICYGTHNYNYHGRDPSEMSAKEKYLAQADGRDCGLRNIDENDAKAFEKWHVEDSRCGGHPWEICRGGNSTHISLYVKKKGSRWQLILDGSSCVRVVETVRMAVALSEKGIPINLLQKEEVLRMIRGEDFIGIVPHNVTPKYCHGSFPEEDHIIDFINPWLNNRIKKNIEKYTVWYPLKIMEMEKRRSLHV